MTPGPRPEAGRAPWSLVLLCLAVASIHAAPISAQTPVSTLVAATRGPEAPVDARPGAPNPLDETLIEVRMGRLAAWTTLALTDGSMVLLPVADFLEMAEVDFSVDSLGSVHANLYPGQRPLTFDARLGSAHLQYTPIEVERGELVLTEDGLYASTDLLGRALDVVVRMNWEDLEVDVVNPGALPLGRRAAREARWRAIQGRAVDDAAVPRIPLTTAPVGGAVMDWTVLSNARDPFESASYGIGMGARVFGGSLQVTSRSEGPISQGIHRIDATYQTVFQNSPWLTQLRLGDGFTTGPRIRGVRGVSLTNAPYLRPSYFGTDGFAGRVGPGWEVEIRQAGQILDLTRADEQGAFALDIPLSYGQNAIQVVAFGPHGEVVTTDRLVLLSAERLPAGRLEWGASAGQCPVGGRCAWTSNADIWYGISDEWTIRGGMESFGRDSLPTLLHPYLSATGMVLPGLELSGEAVYDALLRGRATYAPTPHLRVRGAYTSFSTTALDPILAGAQRRNNTEVDVFFRPRPAQQQLLVRASLLRQSLTTGVLTRGQIGAQVPLGNVVVESGLRRETNVPPVGAAVRQTLPFASAFGLVPLPGNRPMTFRAEADFLGLDRLHRLNTRIGYQINSRVQLQAGVQWLEGFGSRLNVSVNALLSSVESITQLSSGGGTPTRVTQLARGALQWDESSGAASFSARPGLERGGITGHVFLDDNGNGRFDMGESGVEGVRMMVGGRTVRTMADGRYTAWDLPPYQAVNLWADSASIPDPTLVPVRGIVEVVVPPSSFGRVDVPVASSREVTGSVVLVAGERTAPAPQVALLLVNTDTEEQHRLRSFSDGQFYLSGVRPGTYLLDLDPDRSTGLQAVTGPIEIEVPGAVRDFAPVGPFEFRVGAR